MHLFTKVRVFTIAHPWAAFLGALGVAVSARLIITLAQLETHHFQWYRLAVNLAVIFALFGGAAVAARHQPRTHQKRRSPQHLGPVLGLALLAPWVGEFLLGNIPLSNIAALPFSMLLYGAGAVVIREVARQTGRGWPTIFLLATAYGVIEAGIVDQSAFNLLSFDDHDFLHATYIPALGINAYNTFAYIAGHAIWSISVPIAFVELLTRQHTQPWLHKRGLITAIMVYITGCVVVWTLVHNEEKFTAAPAQLIAAALVATVLIGAALRLRAASCTHVAPSRNRPPAPWLVGIGSFIAASLFFIKPESWFGIIMASLLLVITGLAIAYWTRQPAWTIQHQFALAAGALLTYAWGGFVLTSLFRPDSTIAWIGNVLFAFIAIALVAYTGRKI